MNKITIELTEDQTRTIIRALQNYDAQPDDREFNQRLKLKVNKAINLAKAKTSAT